jgi:hypothetical protein
MLRVYAQCADAHCPPLSRPHNLHYVGNARRTGLRPARWSLRGFFDREGR